MPNPPKIKPLIAGLSIAASIMFYFAIPQEGEKLCSYQDAGGVWTVGRGHTRDVSKGMCISKEQSGEFYKQDVAEDETAYNRMVKKEQHPNVKAAALDFIFNAGAGNFSSSTLRKKLNAGDRPGACSQFPRWNKAAGKDCRIEENNCPGVITRRKNEKELCLSNVISVCDYNSGHCEPVGLRPSQPLR